MAFLARIETSGAEAIGPLPRVETHSRVNDFTALEWSIIRLARIDPLWTSRAAGPVRRIWNRIAGRTNPELANRHLEALRRTAVLSWHSGFTVPGQAVADFLAAGFTPQQYELLVRSVHQALRSTRAANRMEALA